MMRRKFTVFYKNGDSSRKINHYDIFGSEFCKLWFNIYRRGSHFAHNLKCGQGIYMITIFSCGKVIFQSCLSVQGGPMWPLTAGHQMLAPMGVPLPMIHWTSLYRESSWTWILTVQGHLEANTGDLFELLHLRTPSLSVLTSGGYWSMYSWQAGGTYPTGKRSCLG